MKRWHTYQHRCIISERFGIRNVSMILRIVFKLTDYCKFKIESEIMCLCSVISADPTCNTPDSRCLHVQRKQITFTVFTERRLAGARKLADFMGNVWNCTQTAQKQEDEGQNCIAHANCPKARRQRTKLYRSAVQYDKCYTVDVLFSLRALLLFCSHLHALNEFQLDDCV